MSLSELVDDGYRLGAADLGGRPSKVIVSNVSYQGVEDMSFVLHFHGIPKRLALNHDQYCQLAVVTGSVSSRDWIDAAIVLAPEREADVRYIAIYPATRPARQLRIHRSEPTVDWRGWAVAAAIVAAVLMLSTLYLQWQANHIPALIEQLLR